MTEEEKKEFVEFLAWKKQKKEHEAKDDLLGHPKKDDNKSIPLTATEPIKTSKTSVNKSANHQKEDKIVKIVIIIAVLIFLIYVATRKCSNQSLNSSAPAVASTYADTTAVLNDSGSSNGNSQPEGWTRKEETDPMNDSKSVFVSVISDNTNKLDFPYGDVYVKLTVRRMKKYGVDVLVNSSSGQIYGSEYNGDNYVTIRFDSNNPMRFYFNEASDGSSDVVFLRKRTAFIRAAKKAHKIIVEIPYYQAGRQVFTFTTPKPLEW